MSSRSSRVEEPSEATCRIPSPKRISCGSSTQLAGPPARETSRRGSSSSTLDRLRDEGVEGTIREAKEQQDLTDEQIAEYRPQVEGYVANVMTAPVMIALLGDLEGPWPTYLKHDGPLAAANMMLAARALGYGTVYGTGVVPPSTIRDVLEIPERYELICTITIGVPKTWPNPPEQRELESFVARERIE